MPKSRRIARTSSGPSLRHSAMRVRDRFFHRAQEPREERLLGGEQRLEPSLPVGEVRAEAGGHLVEVTVLVLADGSDGESRAALLQNSLVERVKDLRAHLDSGAGQKV